MSATLISLKDLVYYDRDNKKFIIHDFLRDNNILAFLRDRENIIILASSFYDNYKKNIDFNFAEGEELILEGILNTLKRHFSEHKINVTLYIGTDISLGIKKVDQDNKMSEAYTQINNFDSKVLLTFLEKDPNIPVEQYGIIHYRVLSSAIKEQDYLLARKQILDITQGLKEKPPSPVKKKRKQDSSALIFGKQPKKGVVWLVFDNDDTLVARPLSLFLRTLYLNHPVIDSAHMIIQELERLGYEVKCISMSARAKQAEMRLRESRHYLSMAAIQEAVNAKGLFTLTLEDKMCFSHPVHKDLQSPAEFLKNRKVEHLYGLLGEIETKPHCVVLIDDDPEEQLESPFDTDPKNLQCPLVVIPVSRFQLDASTNNPVLVNEDEQEPEPKRRCFGI